MNEMSVDEMLLHLMNADLRSGWLDPIMWALTTLALPMLLVVPASLWIRGRRREAAYLLLVIGASGLLAVEIQFVTLRPRPDHVRLLMAQPPFPSFPSGHAAIAFGWASFLLLRYGRAALWAMAFAIGVAASRVYVGHHYPSDVLLGAILGAATGAVGYGLAFAGADRRPRWAWWLWAQLAVVLFAGIGAYLGLTRFEFLRWPYMDKVMHFGLYGALAFFLVAWFAERPPVRVVAGLLTIAILDEVVQGLSPARSFDVVDLACTVAGIVVCASLGARAVGLDRRAVVQMTSA